MKLYQLVFSPTGGTAKVCNSIAAGFSCEKETISMLPAQGSMPVLALTENDVVILAVPSFGGRIPAPVKERLNGVKGRGAKTILVIAFGNCVYADTLVELKDLAIEHGFDCVAAITAVTQHSIVPEVANGRPNAADKLELNRWGEAIYRRLAAGKEFAPFEVPGNRPYKEFNGIPFHPSADEKCVFCGRCAAVCPSGAIERNSPNETNHERCITCMACINICPQNARSIPQEALSAISERLVELCRDPKVNEVFGLD
ncbi:MAG TPA: 4Fe-4S binding protein [Clostridiaceae bacterium]|nr:4Fe-4S binding protein [Clostridiaceae bacterium]